MEIDFKSLLERYKKEKLYISRFSDSVFFHLQPETEDLKSNGEILFVGKDYVNFSFYERDRKLEVCITFSHVRLWRNIKLGV